MLSIMGREYASLSFLKSITMPYFCFSKASDFFGSTHNGEINGDFEMDIARLISISATCRLILILWHFGGRSEALLMGLSSLTII